MRKNTLFLSFLILLINFNISGKNVKKEKINSKIIKSRNMKEEQGTQLDINKATKEELIIHKIQMKIANGILDYREKTGGFNDVKELKHIKGVGDSMYKNIYKKFKVSGKIKKKPFNINNVNDEVLSYYGFNKKEIKGIKTYMEKNGPLKNNLDLMEIFDSKRYEELKDIIIYDNF